MRVFLLRGESWRLRKCPSRTFWDHFSLFHHRTSSIIRVLPRWPLSKQVFFVSFCSFPPREFPLPSCRSSIVESIINYLHSFVLRIGLSTAAIAVSVLFSSIPSSPAWTRFPVLIGSILREWVRLVGFWVGKDVFGVSWSWESEPRLGWRWDLLRSVSIFISKFFCS